MHIAFIEKNEQDVQNLLHSCRQCLPEHTVRYSCYPSYDELFQSKEDLNVDILFSDIYLESENEIQCAQMVKRKNPNVQIIFYSSNLDYSLLTYEVAHIYFFLKNDMESRVSLAIERAQSHLHTQIFS